jgi:hypothetical protein
MPRLGRAYPVRRFITPVSGFLAPTFDAVGAGAHGTFATTSSYSHIAAAGTYAIVDVLTDRTATISSVTFGGVAMSVIGGPLTPTGISGNASYARYGLANVTGGTQSVAITVSASTYINSCSLTYKNVHSVGAAQTLNTGTAGTALSQSVTCTSVQVIVQSFGESHNYAITGTSGGTNRYNQLGFSALCMSDATASTTFTGTVAASVTWAAIATVLS